MEYNFEVEYRTGKSNIVADTLSRKDEDTTLMLCAFSQPHSTLLDFLCHELCNSPEEQQIIHAISTGSPRHNLLMYKNRIFLPTDSNLILLVLVDIHNSI